MAKKEVYMTTTESEINAAIKRELERIDKAVVYNLQFVGEKCIIHARSLPSPNPRNFPNFPHIPPHQPNYIDWTANLRSSIGYLILRDGKVVTQGGFEAVGNGTEGAKEGRKYAKEIAARFPKGYALIVVAGMNYAQYVSDRGYDVLDSAELLAEREVPKMLETLGFGK